MSFIVENKQILAFADFASFPVTGAENIIYLDKSNGKLYVWGGSSYDFVQAEDPNAVTSVNGLTGVVTIDADDIDDTSTAHKFVTAADLTNLSNLSGTNTGDQDLSGYVQTTDIDTLAELNSIVTDATLIDEAPNDGQEYVRKNQSWTVTTAGTDNKDVKVSANDTTAGFLEDKVVGVTNKITVTTLNEGLDEDVQINIGSDVFDKAVNTTDNITEGATNKFNVTTDLSIVNKTATTLDVASSDGTDATVPAATQTEAGLLTAADKTKLDNLLTTKSGVVAGASFTGNPKKYTVTFSTAFVDANYTVNFTADNTQRIWTVEAQTAAGFTINANANAPISGNVYWVCIKHGES